MLPSLTQVKQYISLVVIPPLAGIAADWLIVHVHFLGLFHITAASLAGELTQLGVWGVTTLIAFLASHNILKSALNAGPYSAGTGAWSAQK